MSSLALMRWLESTPERYDAGMRVITLGRVTPLHEAVARAAVPQAGCRVLEVGCGTGAVTQRLVARGAHVTALDQNAQMLDQARRRVVTGDGAGDVERVERTASEIGALAVPRRFDSIVFSLCLSEMSQEERRYVLRAAREGLRTDGPRGRVVVADEVVAVGPARWLQRLLRAPQWLLAWLIAGSTSLPIPDLRGELAAARLVTLDEQRWLAGTLALFVAEPRS